MREERGSRKFSLILMLTGSLSGKATQSAA